ncbi:MAG: DUF4282 domain-containing protein [Opitutales bacterium]|nr:DUF4282 domain-containing protein [Opitutales bacterium]
MIEDPKGFLTALFDLSFKNFITTKLVKFIYILELVFIAIGALGSLIGGFAQGITSGLLSLILVPIFTLLAVMFARVWCEMLIVIFRICEDVSKIARSKE